MLACGQALAKVADIYQASACVWCASTCFDSGSLLKARGAFVQVISAIENGQPLLMENLPEDIDAVLDPVIGKLTFKRGRNLILKVGDAEVEYDPNFR